MIILLIGKTASGKDTIAGMLKEMGIPQIVSYTTRPIREGEVNGREHWFVNNEEMDKLVEEGVLAYDTVGKYRYCAKAPVDGDWVYTINPNAIESVKSVYHNCHSIYVNLDEKTIRERALKRGDKVEELEDRLELERDEFDEYHLSHKWDVLIDTAGSKEVVKILVKSALAYLRNLDLKGM
jgi:guanylate kinase